MPTAMPSPTGSNYAKKFLPANWPNPTMAYDSKRGLDTHNVERAALFLRQKLGQDGMKKFQKLLAEDESENESGEELTPLEKLRELLQQTLKGEDLSQAEALISAAANPGNADDDTDIGDPPSKREDAETVDQPPPFQGRPLCNSHATDSRRSPPSFAMDNSQGDALKRARALMNRVQVIG
jgi:hypothetical protein